MKTFKIELWPQTRVVVVYRNEKWHVICQQFWHGKWESKQEIKSTGYRMTAMLIALRFSIQLIVRSEGKDLPPSQFENEKSK